VIVLLFRPMGDLATLNKAPPPPPQPMAQQPTVAKDLLIIESSRSYSDTSHSAGLLWTSDQPDAETSDNIQHSQQTNTHAPARLEPTIWGKERPQTRALNRPADVPYQIHQILQFCVSNVRVLPAIAKQQSIPEFRWVVNYERFHSTVSSN
jgi:hypothetical protein